MLTRSWLAHRPHAEAVGSHGADGGVRGTVPDERVCTPHSARVCVTHLDVYGNGLETYPRLAPGRMGGVYGSSCEWRRQPCSVRGRETGSSQGRE